MSRTSEIVYTFPVRGMSSNLRSSVILEAWRPMWRVLWRLRIGLEGTFWPLATIQSEIEEYA